MILTCRIAYLECRLPLVSTRNNWPLFLSGGEISPGLSGRLLKTVLHRMKQRRKRSCDLFIVARAKLAVHVNQLSIADITEPHSNRRGLNRGDFEEKNLDVIHDRFNYYLLLYINVLCCLILLNVFLGSPISICRLLKKTIWKCSTCFHSIICQRIKLSFRNRVYLLLYIYIVTVQKQSFIVGTRRPGCCHTWNICWKFPYSFTLRNLFLVWLILFHISDISYITMV